MNHQARKRFGQNFLHDHNIINTILSHAQLLPDQHWVEIGPGLGALTQPLLREKVRLDVVELDRDLVAHLNKHLPASENLTIHSADALKFDFGSLAAEKKTLHIIGNLPYNISTPLLFHLLDYPEYINEMLFMLQKEVVDRICAQPGSKKYGRLSVMIQYYCACEFLFDVPPQSFNPQPKVMSAIVRLTPHRIPPVKLNNLNTFNQLVAKAFSQRRKTIRKSLQKMLSAETISALGIDPGLRAECLTLEQYAILSNAIV